MLNNYAGMPDFQDFVAALPPAAAQAAREGVPAVAAGLSAHAANAAAGLESVFRSGADFLRRVSTPEEV